MSELLQTFATQSALAIVNARLFRELETKTSELEIASRHKSEFLASMSHELRTPLNAVIGFSEVLLDRMFGEINERQDEYLRDIWNSGRHLLELLNEILDLSKVEAGKMVLEPSTFTVGSALEDALAMVRERAALHAISVTVEVADDVGMIVADELRFKQVVLNLLSNAVKFTPDGGSVSIRAFREGNELTVTVTDTGIGVASRGPGADLRVLPAGPPRSSEGGGHRTRTDPVTTDRRAVRRADVARERPGRRKHVRLLHAGLQERGDEVASPDAGELPVVVLVDDDRASLDLISAYLDGSPAQVLRAWDGVEALELIRRVLPAAVVLDIKLPRLDGWQVLAELKADPTTAAIPVVIASVVDDRPGAWPSVRTCISSSRFVATTWSMRCDAWVHWRVGVRTQLLGVVVTSRRILVVEDNPLNLKLVRDVLQFAGYDVIEAQSGEEGLRAAQEDPRIWC